VGKEVKKDVASQKSRMISDLVERGVDQFLLENSDKAGYSSVLRVDMSGDLRTAHVYIRASSNDVESVIKILDANKHEVTNKIKKLMSTKYFPKIEFRKGEDEVLVF